MANKKISELPKASELSGQEEFVFALGGTNGTVTADKIKEHVTKGFEAPEVDTSKLVTTDTAQSITGKKTFTALALKGGTTSQYLKADGSTQEEEEARKNALGAVWDVACQGHGKYNATTGLFELNEITNLTEFEALDILSCYSTRKSADYSKMFFANRNRALLPVAIPNVTSLTMANAFQSIRAKKIVFVSNVEPCVVKVGDATAMFNSSEVEEIEGILIINGGSGPFNYAMNLREVQIQDLNKSIPFVHSPKLSWASIKYMVTNAANTSAITITVHPDVYAKLIDESNAEWHQLLLDAVEKNISFATV